MKPLVLVAAVAAALAVPVALPAGPTSIPAGNLVQNPGGEADQGAADTATTVTPSGWSTTGTFTAVRYGTPGGFPTSAIAAETGGGVNFFAGGTDAAVSTATQTIDVAGAAAEIDAGRVKARLSALLGGYETQSDAAKVDAVYLDETAAQLGRLTVGPVTPTDRASKTTLLARSTEGAVPAKTRQIRVAVTATRTNGTYNDGYADNVSVELSESTSPPPTGQKPTLLVRCGSGHTLVATVKPRAGQKIARVTFVIRGTKGSRKLVDRTSPFAVSVPTAAFSKQLTVTASVALATGTAVLKKSFHRC